MGTEEKDGLEAVRRRNKTERTYLDEPHSCDHKTKEERHHGQERTVVVGVK